jgi:parvulin-like peptidyl-prolyl isomerase
MTEGWKQLLEDLGSALGIGSANRPSSSEEVKDQSADSGFPTGSSSEESEQLAPLEVTSIEESQSTGNEPVELDTVPTSAGQKLISSAGLAVAFVLAVGFGWYVYFGGPKPPAPDVVATFDGGQITIEQVHEHLEILAPEHEMVFEPTFENYRLVVDHMLLNELVRRWAAEQRMDASARFKDAMRHISESVALDEWVASLHQDEMLSSVSDSEIQAFYGANPDTFATATLGEVREQIRQTLAHENQESFFEEYLARLRSEASIRKEYELLEVPAPTDEEVKKFYNDNSEQFNLPKQALVDRIFVAVDGAEEEADTQARVTAEEARAALQAGKEFVEVASKYSLEPYSPAGVTIESGMDDPDLVEQAFSLSQEGDLSAVISTENGYYVLRLREQRPARQLSLEEARPQAMAAVQSEKEGAWFEQNTARTLFTIHGERFTLGQFYHEYQNLPPELQTQFSGSNGLKELADLLIDRMLVLEDAYNRLVDQENAPLLEEARASILRQMIHEAEVDSQVKVTDQDVQEYYEGQKEHFATPPEARIQSIRIYLGETEDERKRAWTKAEEAYRKLVPGFARKPADFDQVAQEYDESDGSLAGGEGSELGDWIRMGDDPVLDLVAHPLHEYIFALPVNSVSQPFEYGQDIYIVKVLERVEPKPLDFEQVKDYIRGELESRQHEVLDTEVAFRLLKDADARVYDQTIQAMLQAERAVTLP